MDDKLIQRFKDSDKFTRRMLELDAILCERQAFALEAEAALMRCQAEHKRKMLEQS